MKVLALCLLIAGCHHAGPLKGSGVPTDAPFGYVKLCVDHPEFEGCKP